MQHRILRRKEVEKIAGVSRSTLYDWMKAGLFPRPVKIGPRAVGWTESAVEAWLSARINASGE